MPRSRAPRIGALAPSGRLDALRETGGQPVELEAPGASPKGGVALQREWTADQAQVTFSRENLDALFFDAAEPAELTGLLTAALRLDLPVVVAAPLPDPFAVAFVALGFAPLTGDAVEVAVEVARNGWPRPRALIEGFSLANALRAGLSAGAGPELLVHLAAIAREAGVVGFGQMIRVLSPESPTLTTPGWFEEHGVASLFAHLGDALHDTPTVTGRLKETLPPAPRTPETGGPRLVFVRGRASGAEVLCRVDATVTEIPGECRFFASEEEAVHAVEIGEIEAGALLIVAGCGPLGGPGLLRLDRLGHALDEAGLTVPVLTDGLAPEGAVSWASLWTPEAAASGVIGSLRDGDFLRLDLAEGRIRTGIDAEELARREPFEIPTPSGFGYVARYVRSALPALEGAGFG